MANTKKTLRRTLTLWQATISGIGVILGAGVYALISPAAGLAGGALWLAFAVSSVIAGLTAFSYARLGSLYPRDSAEFQYTSAAFGKRVGLVAGWIMVTADILAAAAVSLGFAGYAAYLTGFPPTLCAVGLIGLIGVLLLAGITQSVWLAAVLTLIEVGGLLIVIVVGLPSVPSANLMEMPRGLEGVWMASALILFAYLGFDELGNLAEEMKDPARDLPRALFLSMFGSTVIYVLVAMAAVAVVGWEALSQSAAPLTLVVSHHLGANAGTLISLMALAATANTVLLLLLSASRSLYGMGVAGVLPAALSTVSGAAVPTLATVVPLVAAALFVLLGDVHTVASLTDGAILIAFMLVNASLLSVSIKGETRAGAQLRWAERVLAAVAFLACGLTLLRTGAPAMGVALGISVVAWIAGRWTIRPTDETAA